MGALVYSLHKAGEENPALVEKYINAVAEVEKAIEEIKANMTDDERAEVEAQETAETEEAPAEEPAAEKPSRARKLLRKSLSTCAVRQRSARSARPKLTAMRCSATTAALSCKPRKQRGSVAFVRAALPTLDKFRELCKMERIAHAAKAGEVYERIP